MKVYGLFWAFFAAIAGILFLTGNFGEITIVVFGFIAFEVIFMGMIAVLPATVAHPSSAPKEKLSKLETKNEADNLGSMTHLPLY